MSKNMSCELKTMIKTLSFSLVLALITGTIVYYTSLNEALLSSLGKVILIFTVFMTGCSVSKSYGNKGLVRGMTMGTVYFILILIATLVFIPSLLSFASVVYTLLICLAAGGLGGILGIGLSDV